MFPRKAILVAYLLAVLLAVGIVGRQIWIGYDQQLRAARSTVDNLAEVLQQRLEATLRRTDATLEFLVEAAREETLQPAARSRHERDINRFLAMQRLKFNEISAFRYIDADGDLLYTSDPVRNYSSLADRPYFRKLRDDPDAGLVYSDVQISRFTGQTVIVVGRGIRSASGRFLGAAIAVFELATYGRLFDSIDVGPRGTISLRRTDSRLILRKPVDPALVNRPIRAPIQQMIEDGADRGVIRYAAATDGIDRLFAFRRIGEYPFYCIVGVAMDDELAAWRNQSVVSAGLAFAALLIFSWLLQHQARAYAREAEHARLLHEREQTLRDALQAAESANRAKSAFLATMSHEIRTPMNGVLGMAQVLMDPEIGEAERIDGARTIYDSGNALLAILNDILDLSKVEAGKVEIDRVVFSPAQLLQEIQMLFGELAQAKGIDLDAVWRQSEVCCYLGDPKRLRQILSNLVSNAIKFSEKGRIEIIGEESRNAGKLAVLTFRVADQGVGIPADRQHLLFQPFTQLDSTTTRKFEGTGLGLAIARGLVTRMNGEIGCESRAGEGSTFWFTVEVGTVAADVGKVHGADCAGASHPDEVAAAGKAGAMVLVVEDNATNQKVVAALLRKLDYRTHLCANGQEAVRAMLGGLAPDLVLMDVQMPVMGGIEATERIRLWERESRQPRVPIIALTAGAFDEDRENCLAAGMDGFLAKPVDLTALAAAMNKWQRAGSRPLAAE